MRFDPRPWILDHWPIKLVALFLSVVIWIAVAAERPRTQIVPVDVTIALPPGLSLSQPAPNASALISGAARDVLVLSGARLLARKVVGDSVGGGPLTIQLSPSDIVLPDDADVSVDDVQPRVLRVTLSETIRRSIRVNHRVNIRLDSGFAIVGGVTLVPAQVEIEGSRAAIEAITSVSTVPAEISSVRNPVRRRLAIDAAPLGSVKVRPAEVEVIADVAPVTERVFTDVRVVVPDEGWQINPSVVTLTVTGPVSRILSIAPDSVLVSAIPSKEAVAGDQIKVLVVAPNGLTASVMPSSVTIVRRAEE